jgi:hypothetical protein
MFSEYYPYPPRPGIQQEDCSATEAESATILDPESLQTVIEFEHQLYAAQLDPARFPTADLYKQEQEDHGTPLQPLETIWQKKINSTTLGLSYFLTPDGREALESTTGHALRAETIEDVEKELSRLDISNVSSEVLRKLGGSSVGHEEALLTKAFLDSGFDADAVPRPHFLQVHKNPEVISEKAIGYRQLKAYISKALTDLRSGATEADPAAAEAEILLTRLYRRRLNDFIASTYVSAYKFAFQATRGEQDSQQALVTRLESALPAFNSSRGTAQIGDFLMRMDRYSHGVSIDEEGHFTWLSKEAKDLAGTAGQQPKSEPVDRDMYSDISPESLSETEVEGTVFGELLQGVLESYGLLSEHLEWDSEREGPAADGRWQVVVDESFKILAVDSKQRIMKVPAKKATLLRIVTVGSHELTHVIQHHNKVLLGNLAILGHIGLDDASEQTESGGIWQEKEARQVLTGKVDNDINGIGYLKALGGKDEGKPFGHLVKLGYDNLIDKNPALKPDKAAAQAVNRARRAYASGGFEYAQDLPVITNSRALSYLEQGLIYKGLSPEQRRLLFVGGISIANMQRLSRTGLVDLDKIYIPSKTPWELMYPRIKELATQ